MKTIIPERIEHFLHSASGDSRFFSVLYFKQNNELRHLVGRFGVSYPVKGIRPSPTSLDRPFLLVWDIKAHGLRLVNITTVLALKVSGEIYLVESTWKRIQEFVPQEVLQAALEELRKESN